MADDSCTWFSILIGCSWFCSGIDELSDEICDAWSCENVEGFKSEDLSFELAESDCRFWALFSGPGLDWAAISAPVEMIEFGNGSLSACLLADLVGSMDTSLIQKAIWVMIQLADIVHQMMNYHFRGYWYGITWKIR